MTKPVDTADLIRRIERLERWIDEVKNRLTMLETEVELMDSRLDRHIYDD